MVSYTIGTAISQLRKERNLTQDDLASQLGVSYQAVSKWETGTSCPDVALLPKLSSLFGVSVDYLFGRSGGSGTTEIQDAIVNLLAQVEPESRYDLAFRLFKMVFDGLSQNVLYVENPSPDQSPAHLSNKYGVSFISFKGLGALMTADYLRYVELAASEKYAELFSALADTDSLSIVLACAGLDKPTLAAISQVTGLDNSKVEERLTVLRRQRLVEASVSPENINEIIFRIRKTVSVPLLVMLGLCRFLIASQNGISCVLGECPQVSLT